MRAFRFRLQPVLKLKERQKRVAELRRQETLAVLRRHEAEVARLRSELGDVSARLAGAVARNGLPANWQSFSARAQWLSAHLRTAEQAVLQARQAAAAAAEQLRKASVAEETLVELRRKSWQEYRDGVAAQDQQRIEELVLRRWLAQPTDDQELSGKDSP
jgi:flagellar export protein FliJ